MDEQPAPVPILPYAGHSDKARGWRLVMAMKAAGRFTAIVYAISISAAILGILLTSAGDLSLGDIFFVGVYLLFLAVPFFIVSAFSCWIRLATVSQSLGARRRMWPFAIAFIAVLVVGMIIGPMVTGPETDIYLTGAAFIWICTVPACSCFFLLRKVDLESQF